jgi:hypothetical protein
LNGEGSFSRPTGSEHKRGCAAPGPFSFAKGQQAEAPVSRLEPTDAGREYAYDRKSAIGRLDKGLDDAGKYGWVVVDMKKDWKQVFPFSE